MRADEHEPTLTQPRLEPRQRPHSPYAIGVSVRVRMAPSPTGLLHIGGVRTFLFNWLFARQKGGQNLLRIENTDTSREVAEAVGQIQESLRSLGIEWDGEVTFQLDRMDDCRRVAAQLVADGKAYADEGAIRFRMPDEGVTAWDDVVRGRIEYPNEIDFQLSYGEWVRLFAENGLVVESLIETRPRKGERSPYLSADETKWARRWPLESIWRVRKLSDSLAGPTRPK